MAPGRRHPRSDRCVMSGWNLADIWEAAADQIPDAPFSEHVSWTLTWGTTSCLRSQVVSVSHDGDR
jgi:hypothetical protein